ncbi:hypothetical protein I3760_10G130100 [Carya illinoinensis]|uniref:GATA-type domain-containing protein n=1 Tax=Carya illinoinensis TaxID=32201 RepID=A0A8T1PFI3_CARIL|nr:hypothetical protein I3760_10G130100 [Carya illinoinensis]KAG6639867.1 hypothetical protein CIPAW_10G131900 [Carya illinoinensis]
MGMMDRIENESLSEAITVENKKCCADCKTTKTPLWRGGLVGPKSSCNACGIKYRKRRKLKEEVSAERLVNSGISWNSMIAGCEACNHLSTTSNGKGSSI